METQKVMTYGAMGVAGLVTFIFLLDAIFGIAGQNFVLDVLFILGAAFVLWQGFETMREFR
jgi:threonine/homoserine/homoserine lactone efflux protein